MHNSAIGATTNCAGRLLARTINSPIVFFFYRTAVDRRQFGSAKMSESDKAFTGSIPENYDRYMVPLIFESYAQDLARRAAALAPKAVLETAAGSGVVTRA